VITDGAPVYLRLCTDNKLKRLSCNHSKGVFCKYPKKRDGTSAEVRTGSIDGMWRFCKMCVPPSQKHRDVDVPFAPVAMALVHWQQRFGSCTWQSHSMSRKTEMHKKAAEKMHPLRHFLKTDPKSVTHFRAVFWIPQKSTIFKNPFFTTVKTQL